MSLQNINQAADEEHRKEEIIEMTEEEMLDFAIQSIHEHFKIGGMTLSQRFYFQRMLENPTKDFIKKNCHGIEQDSAWRIRKIYFP